MIVLWLPLCFYLTMHNTAFTQRNKFHWKGFSKSFDIPLSTFPKAEVCVMYAVKWVGWLRDDYLLHATNLNPTDLAFYKSRSLEQKLVHRSAQWLPLVFFTKLQRCDASVSLQFDPLNATFCLTWCGQASSTPTLSKLRLLTTVCKIGTFTTHWVQETLQHWLHFNNEHMVTWVSLLLT